MSDFYNTIAKDSRIIESYRIYKLNRKTKMDNIKRILLLIILSITYLTANSVSAASEKIGILVFDGFLTSDVTAPIEVFGAASKKAWFSSYEVVVISTTKNKTVVSEEGLKIIADKTIYDELKLDVLIVPSAYDMDSQLNNKDLIQYIGYQLKTGQNRKK